MFAKDGLLGILTFVRQKEIHRLGNSFALDRLPSARPLLVEYLQVDQCQRNEVTRRHHRARRPQRIVDRTGDSRFDGEFPAPPVPNKKDAAVPAKPEGEAELPGLFSPPKVSHKSGMPAPAGPARVELQEQALLSVGRLKTRPSRSASRSCKEPSSRRGKLARI